MFAGREGLGALQYPIRDVDWREGLLVCTATKDYRAFVEQSWGYSRIDPDRLVEKGNAMVVECGGVSLAAGKLQEINSRKKAYIVGRIRECIYAYRAIASQLVEIAERGVLPEYSGPGPSEEQPPHYPYVIDDTEKIVKKMRNDIMGGILLVCEKRVSDGRQEITTHASAVVRKGMHGRTPGVDYRIRSAHCTICAL